MGLISSDPLALMAIEAGLIRAPLADAAAEGNTQLDRPQRAAVIGEPIPIVFCRRDETAGTGGVLISPPATEARFTNDASNAVTASYHLILSEGQIGSIQVRDVFQRSCRVGSHTQTYNRRAGTWAPGNFITTQAGYDPPACPYYCGTVGVYTGMSTLSFTITIPDGFDQWNRQVHAFIRNGMHVTRLLDGVFGPSNNFADLVNWGLQNCARLPASQIDTGSLQTAARFLAANSLNCDIAITESHNLADLLAEMAPYFLLAETRNQGRRGLRPLLPTNSDGSIRTTAVPWVFEFTEDHILPDGFEISMTPPADRRPFCAQTIWRQQLTDDVGIIRTSEVRYTGEAVDGPYEQHDLSAFCTRENHAVKVGAYVRARRQFITHSAVARCRTIDFPPLLAPGDIVRVRLERNPDVGPESVHDYLYQVDRITKTAAGEVAMDLVHFPIDSSGRSLVALAVNAAVGSGIVLTSNRTGVSCDVNSSSDTTVPAESYQEGTAADDQVTMAAAPAEETPGNVGGEVACSDGYANIAFRDVHWEGTELVFTLRLLPLGRAPDLSAGDLQATVTSGLVLAYDEDDRLVSPQPVSLPSVNVTETVAEPWETGRPAEYYLYPFPPVDWVFEKEFRVQFQESDFPAIGSGIARYEMPLTISSTSGGFCDVFAVNSARATFNAIENEEFTDPFIAICYQIDYELDLTYAVKLDGNTVGTVGPHATHNDKYPVWIITWTSDSAAHDAIRANLATKLAQWDPDFFSGDVLDFNTVIIGSGPAPTGGNEYEWLMQKGGSYGDSMGGPIVFGRASQIDGYGVSEWIEGGQYPGSVLSGTVTWSVLS